MSSASWLPISRSPLKLSHIENSSIRHTTVTKACEYPFAEPRGRSLKSASFAPSCARARTSAHPRSLWCNRTSRDARVARYSVALRPPRFIRISIEISARKRSHRYADQFAQSASCGSRSCFCFLLAGPGRGGTECHLQALHSAGRQWSIRRERSNGSRLADG